MCYTSFRVHNVRPSPPPPYLTDARSLFYHCTFFYVPRQDVKKLLAPILKAKSFFCLPLNFGFKDCSQLNFQSSTLCVSDNSSQSSGFPHLRRYSCPPSTAHDSQEQNLKSCTVQLSITSLHFLHRIIFLTIFIMHVTRSQSSAFISFFESQIIFFKALVADIHNMQPIFPCELAEDDRVHLDSLHVLAAHQESHILKALEGVGEDVLLHILPGITPLLINAG